MRIENLFFFCAHIPWVPDNGRNIIMTRRPKYGIFKMLIDLALILITGGLWIVVIVVREIRHNRRG